MPYLVYDIGTSGTKAGLLDDSGTVLKHSYCTYPTHTASAGIVEQDATNWWQAACELARELKPQTLDGIILTGQMQNLILLAADGNPLRKVILYSDARATAEAEIIKQRFGTEPLRSLTGNDQEASGLLAKLCWLQKHEPLMLQKARHLLLGAADFLAFKLTGQAATDTTTASTTGLMKLEERTWLEATLFEDLGLANLTTLLPNLLPGGKQLGLVWQDAAELLGIQQGTPVFLAPGDAGTATLGIGSGEAGKPYAYIGTSGWVAFSSEQRGNPESGVFTLAHPEANSYICVAPLLTAGGNLDWAYQQLGYINHEQMIDTALTQAPSKLIYLPYLNGERSPFNDPHARGAFIGLTSHHNSADLARAVLEGLAFAYKHALEALITEPVSELALTGGGTRSLGFCQLLADITGLAVLVAAEAEYTGLRGALLAVQVANKTRSDYQLEPHGLRLEPDPEANYQEKYLWFRTAYQSLKHLFHRMAG